MRYLLIVLFSIGLIIGIQFLQKKDHDAEKLVILAVIHYFMGYVIASGLLFWTNCFTIDRAVLLTAGMFLVIFLWMYFKADKQDIRQKRNIKGRSEWLPLLAVFAAIVFSCGHFEFYGMGQDQGVYQTEAVNLYYDVPMKGVIIDEYDELTDQDYKKYYEEFVSARLGYDLLADSTFVPGINKDSIQSDVEGIWHGIPTYAAMLGLSAKIFGLPHMQILGTIFFICLLYLMEFILSAFHIKQGIRALAVLLLGVSPEIIWIKKSTLTEGFLAVLVLTYLYYLTAVPQKEHLKSSFPIVVFSYFHVTVFTMMPMFLFIYWVLFFRSRDNVYLKCAKISIAGYLTGFLMMWMVQPRYTLTNYRNAFRFLSLQQLTVIIGLVAAASITAYIITEIFSRLLIENIQVSDVMVKKCIKYACLAGAGLIFAWIVMKQYTFLDCQMLTLVCYSILSGIILVPIIFVKICRQKYEIENRRLVLAVMFVWCVIIYAAVMRRDIPYYYYYARYIMPYISLIPILYLILEKKVYKQAVCLLFGCLMLFPAANTLRNNNDDSCMEWNIVMEIIENTKDASAVLLDVDGDVVDISRLLYYPLKAGAGVKVYPVLNTLEETLEYIPEQNKSQCIYITNNVENNADRWTKLIYRNTSVFQEDTLDHTSKWSRLVTEFPEQQYVVSMYKIFKETKMLDGKTDEYFTSGWASVNDAGYRWMLGNTASADCFLQKKDYLMQIINGDTIPFDNLSKDKLEVDVYFNDRYIYSMEYTKDSDKEIKIGIPEELVNDGYNEIIFKGDSWSPAEYGSEDNNRYGFSVSYIAFIPEGEDDLYASSRDSF